MAAGLSSATLLALGSVLLVSFIVGELFERIGIESIIGYILTGVMMGPLLSELASRVGFVQQSWAIQPGTLAGFGTIGATLILFSAGLREENVVDIFMHEEGLDLGIATLVGAFAFIIGALILFGDRFLPYSTPEQLVFLALAYAVVDIGVPSKIMLERDMLGKEIGSYTIKASVINVTAAFSILTVLVLVSSPGLESVVLKLAGIFGFALLFFLLHEFIHMVDRYIIMFEETEAQFAITFALLLFLAYITELVGLSSVLGAFFAGVIVSRSDFSESEAFQEKVRAVGQGIFIPIFFAWFGLGLKIFGATGILNNLEAALFLFGLSTVSKLAIGYAVPRIHGYDSPATVAASLLSLDIETLVILLIGVDLGVFPSTEILQIFAPSVLFTTLTIAGLYAVLDRRR